MQGDRENMETKMTRDDQMDSLMYDDISVEEVLIYCHLKLWKR